VPHAMKQRAVQASASVWGTEDCEPAKAYDYFQAAVREGFLPWRAKQVGDARFSARIEALHVDRAFIGKINIVETISVRTEAEVSASEGEYFYASFNLAGSMTVEQGTLVNTTRPGDLVIFDSTRPTQVSSRPSQGRTHSSAIALMIPKSSFSCFDAEAHFTNARIPREALLPPLANALALLANRLVSAPGPELAALYEACVDLLPVAAGAFDEDTPAFDFRPANESLREVLCLIQSCLGDAQLSARFAADSLGLSERYIHKLFAGRGTTFGGYVTEQRLSRVRGDLTTDDNRFKPIANIAYRWGFNDLSTFNRAFRKRFGCTPSAVRKAAVHGSSG
jgi:AraC family transcriptional regulator, positive regulator of tynA and feaB